MWARKIVLVVCALLHSFHNGVQALNCSSISSSSGTRYCGKAGYIDKHLYYATIEQYAASVDICKKWCLERTDETAFPKRSKLVPQQLQSLYTCYSFSYGKSSQLCTLYPYPLEPRYPDKTIGFKPKNTSSTLYWDRNCFECTRACPLPDSNYIDNPGFDISRTFFGPWDTLDAASNYTVVSPGHNSTYALGFPAAQDYDYYYGGVVFQVFQACSGLDYLWSFDLKVENVLHDHKKPATISWDIADLRAILTYQIAESPTWQTITTSYRVDSSAFQSPNSSYLNSIQFAWDPSPEIALYLDNVVVRPAPSTFTTVGGNVLSNGGFETGKLAPWVIDPDSFNAGVVVKSPGLTEGNYAAFGTLTGTTSGGADLYLSQLIDVQPYQPYLFSYDWKLSPSDKYDLNTIIGDSTSKGYSSKNQTKWAEELAFDKVQTAQRVFTPVTKSVQVIINLAIYDTDDVANLIVDNVQVRKIVI